MAQKTRFEVSGLYQQPRKRHSATWVGVQYDLSAPHVLPDCHHPSPHQIAAGCDIITRYNCHTRAAAVDIALSDVTNPKTDTKLGQTSGLRGNVSELS